MFRLCLFRPKVSTIRKCMYTTSPGSKQSSGADTLKKIYKPDSLQKFFLVWTKKYKTKDEIPESVSLELLDRARTEARIKLSNILMCMTALASLGAILAGKSAAKRGESVHQMNLDWHKKYEEDFKKNNPEKQ